MKLRYEYKVDTWAKDEKYDAQHSLSQTIDNCDVEFTFDADHAVTRMFISIPNVKIMLNEMGIVDAFLDEKSRAEAHSLANYIANMLHLQTGKCNISEVCVLGYVPETETNRKKLKRTHVQQKPFGIDAILKGKPNLSKDALSRYITQKDALAIYIDAERMANLTGKYREFFRVLDHYFPYTGQQFDREVHQYLRKFDPKYTIKYIAKIRDLRNRCSHAKSGNKYITSNDFRGMKELRDRIRDVRSIAKLLLDNPPS